MLERSKTKFSFSIAGVQRKQIEYADQDLFFSYCAFNQALKFSPGIVPISEAEIDWREIYPNGMTSLYDAIGSSIQYLKSKLRIALENDKTDVVMLILTDGFENSSKIFNAHEVKYLIEELELNEKWTFLFLGAGLNVEEATKELNRKGKNSFSFEKNSIENSIDFVSEEINDFLALKSRGVKRVPFLKLIQSKNRASSYEKIQVLQGK
ncbi:hypothetical protein ADICYQ_0013 [Cyclobacterium qasimii M12-11B]|uniref:VWFA domain-containing protein n=1 Tax=Cyclobacterium qasimii M12-11B TaxID=641524 RepID=S7VNJ8_9BACT|nr:hypothetical protein ADICYQ_0013 [Cyclobacterium qasimii M12-11B]